MSEKVTEKRSESAKKAPKISQRAGVLMRPPQSGAC